MPRGASRAISSRYARLRAAHTPLVGKALGFVHGEFVPGKHYLSVVQRHRHLWRRREPEAQRPIIRQALVDPTPETTLMDIGAIRHKLYLNSV
jgi:hypothetical protein